MYTVATPFGPIDLELDDGLVPKGYVPVWDDRPVLRAPTRWSPAVGFVNVPVVDGLARLPDGRTVASESAIVRVPYAVQIRRRKPR